MNGRDLPDTAGVREAARRGALHAVLAESVQSELAAIGRFADHGLVLYDPLGLSIDYWLEEIQASANTELIGEVRGAGAPLWEPPKGLELPPAREASPLRWPSPDIDRWRANRPPGGPAGIVLIREPRSLDSDTAKCLAVAAEHDGVGLFIHAADPGDLPVRWRRLVDVRLLRPCPRGTIPRHAANPVVEAAVGRPVPVVGAVALCEAAGWQADQLDLLVAGTPPKELEHALLSTSVEAVLDSHNLRYRVRARWNLLPPEAAELVAATAFRGHLPPARATQAWGLQAVGDALQSGLVVQRPCGGTPVLECISPLVGQQLRAGIDPFRAIELEARLSATGMPAAPVAETCCGQPLLRSALTLQAHVGLEPGKLVAALEGANDRNDPDMGRPIAAALTEHHHVPEDLGEQRRTVLALALHAYLDRGPLAALRVLNRAAAADPMLLHTPEAAAVAVRICSETGRLLPTVRRMAAARGLPLPGGPGDPRLLRLLPPDRMLRLYEGALRATEAGNLRTAAIRFTAAFQHASKFRDGHASPNTTVLRCLSLAGAAGALALAGYRSQFQELLDWLAANPQPWHAWCAGAVELAVGIVRWQEGASSESSQACARARECSGVQGQEAIVELVGAWQSGTLPACAQDTAPGNVLLRGRRDFERIGLSDVMDDPTVLGTALSAAGHLDPRARCLVLAADAAMGLHDPVDAARTCLEQGQGRLAGWILEGVLTEGADSDGTEGRDREGLHATALRLARRLEPDTAARLPAVSAALAARRLTPREEQVARLAAAGRKNREIAHELVVSLRTVEGHLASVLAKLGVADRGQLPDYL